MPDAVVYTVVIFTIGTLLGFMIGYLMAKGEQ